MSNHRNFCPYFSGRKHILRCLDRSHGYGHGSRLGHHGTGFDSRLRHQPLGIALDLLAAIGQAIGAILSHAAFLHMNISPLRSALLRFIGGNLLVLIFMRVLKDRNGRGYENLKSFRRWGTIIFTVFIGTFMGIWLQQVSLKYAAAGIAQTLFSTSPLFVIPMVAVSGESVSLRALLGVMPAIFGIGLIFGLQ